MTRTRSILHTVTSNVTLILTIGTAGAFHAKALAADNGAGPVQSCSDYDDDCEFLACMCLQEYGSDVGNHWESTCMDIDGERICECFCDFGHAGGSMSCLGGWGDISRGGDSCEVQFSADGDDASRFEIIPADTPCDDLFCRLNQEHDLLILEYQTIDGFQQVAPVQTIPDDSLYTAIIDNAPTYNWYPIAEQAEFVDQPEVVEGDMTPNSLIDIRDACEEDHDGDGVPDASFALSPDGTWACCRPNYGCMVCFENEAGCDVRCSSRECEADQLLGDRPDEELPGDNDVVNLLSNSDGSVTAVHPTETDEDEVTINGLDESRATRQRVRRQARTPRRR